MTREARGSEVGRHVHHSTELVFDERLDRFSGQSEFPPEPFWTELVWTVGAGPEPSLGVAVRSRDIPPELRDQPGYTAAAIASQESDGTPTLVSVLEQMEETHVPAFSWSNYLLACSGCNSNFKREKFPLDDAGAPLLIDPTAEDPREHLVLSVKTGKYRPRTREGQASRKGQESIEVFGLGRDLLEKGRQDAWHAIPAFLLRYDDLCSRGDWMRAIETQRTLCRFPFASVFVWFLDIASAPYAADFIEQQCLAVLDKYPDIKDWL